MTLPRQSLTLLLYIIMFMMIGCAEPSAAPPRTDKPPLPIVSAASGSIAPVQSSYCWKTGCADYAGGKTLAESAIATAVNPGETISIRFDYKPSPTHIELVEFIGNDVDPVTMDNGQFRAPHDRGTYYYGLSANWLTADGQYSNGDTSAVFAIEVSNQFSAAIPLRSSTAGFSMHYPSSGGSDEH